MSANIAGVDRVLVFESGGALRLIEMNRFTDHFIVRFTASGKTPLAMCWTGTLLVCANGITNLFSIDPAGPWSNPTSGAGGRADNLLYGSVDDCVWGFDKSATPAIKRINKSTLAIVNTYTTGLSNSMTGTAYPWCYVGGSVNSIYHVDQFGQLRKFNCTTQAVTSLSAVVASFGSGNQSVLTGSDGYVYIVSDVGANKQAITCLNPATDTVVDVTDLSSYIATAVTSGFTSISEIQGYLYVSMAGTESTTFGCVIVVRISDRAVVGAIPTYGAAGPVAGYPTAGQNRAYASIGILNAANINAFDR